MSAYCEELVALRGSATHRLKDIGDQWRTPDPVFYGINTLFGPFTLDLFADGDNAKCPAYYTAEDNALAQDWASRLAELGGVAFANPPYGRSSYHDGQPITGMENIIPHAMAMREAGGRYVFLIKAATSEQWWPTQADHIVFIRGRIGFDLPTWFRPADEKQVPSSSGFGVAIAIFDKTWHGPAMSYITREELISRGEAFLALARHAVEKGRNAAPAESGDSCATCSNSLHLQDNQPETWPVEVDLVFNQMPSVELMLAAQQFKLKSHINRMLLERMPLAQILAAAKQVKAAMEEIEHA